MYYNDNVSVRDLENCTHESKCITYDTNSAIESGAEKKKKTRTLPVGLCL